LVGDEKRLYKAMIWLKDSDQPGKRVSVLAKSIGEARQLLEEQHGEGTVFDLHNEEDANKPR
jgi:hypothetical protein